jgi:hypothetical protein
MGTRMNGDVSLLSSCQSVARSATVDFMAMPDSNRRRLPNMCDDVPGHARGVAESYERYTVEDFEQPQVKT